MIILNLKPIIKKGNVLNVVRIKHGNKTQYKGYVKKPFKNNGLNLLVGLGLVKYSIKSDCKKCLENKFKGF